MVFEVLDTYLRERTALLADLDQARVNVGAGRVLTSKQVWERLEKQLAA